jgi:hypothetical protein
MSRRVGTGNNGKLQATILKKCDRTYHRPETNRQCAAGTCHAFPLNADRGGRPARCRMSAPVGCYLRATCASCGYGRLQDWFVLPEQAQI